jgi:hypothetical protein
MPCTTCTLQDTCVAGLAGTVVAVDDRDSIRLEAEGLAGGKVVHAGHVGDRQKRYRGGLTGVGRKVSYLQWYRFRRTYRWTFALFAKVYQFADIGVRESAVCDDAAQGVALPEWTIL